MKIRFSPITKIVFALPSLWLVAFSFSSHGQNTQIRGFLDQITQYKNEKVSFMLGEEAFFINSDFSDRFSFLGETVIRFDNESPTYFNISIERALIKYNFYGNNNLLFGRHHTPVNYWNDTYHHGKVFYPTIWRPNMFGQHIVPLVTDGIGLQGHDLFGQAHFGYDLVIGNGLGSNPVLDNDKYKSVTVAVHVKPMMGLRIGASYYSDHISAGATVDGVLQPNYDVDEKLYSGTLAYFGPRFEFLSEGTIGYNQTDTLGTSKTIAWYAYGGVRFLKRFTAYGRYDKLQFESNELYYNANDQYAIITGLRYQINYLTVVKIEYERDHSAKNGDVDILNAEIAIGF